MALHTYGGVLSNDGTAAIIAEGELSSAGASVRIHLIKCVDKEGPYSLSADVISPSFDKCSLP